MTDETPDPRTRHWWESNEPTRPPTFLDLMRLTLVLGFLLALAWIIFR